MAQRSSTSGIVSNLDSLREVVGSLRAAAGGEIPVGAQRQRVVRLTKQAGSAALPALLRGLASPIETESSWAYYLLGRIGGDRVVERLSVLLRDRDASDETKARALGLLSDLGAPIPADVALDDPESLLARSVNDLLSSVENPRELKQAIQLVVDQVPPAELPAFAAELVRHGKQKALPLLDGLLAMEELSADVLAALTALKRDATASKREREAAHALERGLEYLEAGRPQAALRRLTRFVRTHPEHAEGRSALGVCLLQLGEPEQAMVHLARAAELEPDEPLHRWNQAAAAKQADRLGGAYLALREYLRLAGQGGDVEEGAAERRAEAKSFVRAYERMLRDAHPGVALSDYLRGEELFARAYAALTEGRNADAVAGFEAVLSLMPRHWPSWGNLGAAYLELERPAEAERCLRRALELKPDYQPAQKNLALIEASR
jgi:Flp pilus assembly protein TadD